MQCPLHKSPFVISEKRGWVSKSASKKNTFRPLITMYKLDDFVRHTHGSAKDNAPIIQLFIFLLLHGDGQSDSGILIVFSDYVISRFSNFFTCKSSVTHH